MCVAAEIWLSERPGTVANTALKGPGIYVNFLRAADYCEFSTLSSWSRCTALLVCCSWRVVCGWFSAADVRAMAATPKAVPPPTPSPAHQFSKNGVPPLHCTSSNVDNALELRGTCLDDLQPDRERDYERSPD